MPDLTRESSLHSRGRQRVAGVDEAGRGPLAGPVAAAAVILPRGFSCPGLDDSKKITAARREALYQKLTGNPEVVWAVAIADCLEIDRLNILRATHLAMRRAVEAIVKGDGLSLSIAAASIIAKVTRDRLMREIDREFPQFGFARHQGYGTKEHL
nr:ribonuclease HII [Akkermansiaceae bacterium]